MKGVHQSSDSGAAPIEFIFATVILLLPLLYLLVALAQIQAGAYAAQSTAIDAARTAARYPANPASHQIGELHFDDHDLSHATWDLHLTCDGACSQAGSRVTATVTARIPIPGIPAVFGDTHIPSVHVKSSHTDVVAPAGG